jgi:hypothetical protein
MWKIAHEQNIETHRNNDFNTHRSRESTNDMTHLWRTGTVGAKVVFTEYTPFKSKKELFIVDSKHKQNVINILSKKK